MRDLKIPKAHILTEFVEPSNIDSPTIFNLNNNFTLNARKMRRNSIVLVLLGIVCLSASVVQAARLRSRKSVTKNTVEKKISNHETNGDNHELQEQQNLTVGRKLERKKMRVHKVSAKYLVLTHFLFVSTHAHLIFISTRPNSKKRERGEGTKG
jgi:hypothetical protein